MNTQTKFVLDKLDELGAKSVLNIGFRSDSDLTIMNHVLSKGGTFSIIDAWQPNCNELQARFPTTEIFCGDARHIKNAVNKKYDAVIWLHGPEHIYWQEFLDCRNEIESIATKLVMYQAPIGEWPQDAIYGNPYEVHVQTLRPEMFEELGYLVVSNLESTFAAYLKK